MSKKKLREELDKIPEKKIKPEKEEKRSKKNNLIKIMNYLNENYDFRYNLFAAKPEYRSKVSGNGFVFFNERDFDNLYNEVELGLGVTIPDGRVKSLIGSDKVSPDYDPIREFLFKLPVWDEVDRFPLFLQQVQLKDDKRYRPGLIKYFTMWFVAMVASLVDDYAINEMAIVFTGKQGRGKTRFFTSLVPKELRLMYMYNGSFNPHDKDHLEMIGTKILINLDEMSTLTRTDVETLKSTMSYRYIVLRRAFGRGNIHLFRRASFCGSHNDDKFLTDQTGNRRWLPFAIHDITIDEDFDIKLLYAQALALWKSGYRIWMNKEEIDDFEEYNEQFRFVPMEEELLLACYRKPDKEELATGMGVEYLSTSEIIHAIASKEEYRKMNVNDTSLKRMGKALKALGFVKTVKRYHDVAYPKSVWCIKKLKWEESLKLNNANTDENII